MDAINYAGQANKTFAAKDSLFFKFQGSPSSIKETSEAVRRIVRNHGSTRLDFAKNDREAEDLWHHRKIALWSTMEWVNHPNVRIWTTDVCNQSLPLFILVNRVLGMRTSVKAASVSGGNETGYRRTQYPLVCLRSCGRRCVLTILYSPQTTHRYKATFMRC